MKEESRKDKTLLKLCDFTGTFAKKALFIYASHISTNLFPRFKFVLCFIHLISKYLDVSLLALDVFRVLIYL